MYRFIIFLILISSSHASAMSGIEGLRWGQTPSEVVEAWKGRYELAEQPADPLGKVLYEIKYRGNFLGTYDDGVISAIFYLNRLFAVAVAYGSNSTRRASDMFESLATKMQAKFGPYKEKSKPKELHSFLAMPGIPPLDKIPGGEAELLDLQIRTGFWIPEATWKYKNGASIRILISRGPETPGKMRALSPLLIFSKTNILE